MPMPTISFLLGVVVVGYLLTFVLFALLRIVTGVSVQRIGYSGFRHLSFSPRHGLRINVRGIGLSVHRPTFALPTWCSLVITELNVVVDLQALQEKAEKSQGLFERSNGSARKTHTKPSQDAQDEHGDDAEGHGKLWRTLTKTKEQIKRVHKIIRYIRWIDLVATAASVEVVGVCNVRLERATLSVDTRKQTVDRGRFFQAHKHDSEDQTPAEWKAMFRSVLFTPDRGTSTELLDYCTLNIHGMIHRQKEGLRDASIALKLGRVNIPYDDIEHAKKSAELLRGNYAHPEADSEVEDAAMVKPEEGFVEPGSRERRIVRAVSDSKAFIASILRGIREVQFAISTVSLLRKLAVKDTEDKEVYLSFAMKEFGLDILRLDPKTPAHRMYFSSQDVAHQCLLTGISIAAGINDGHQRPERLLYVPMVTATVKTTLPSRTIQFFKADEPSDRNSNMLYATFVCTSPSLDLAPKHLPLVRRILKQRSSRQKKKQHSDRHQLISTLLPKAHVKLSIQEPVVRIALPPMDKESASPGDFDLLISTCSTIAFECESSHGPDGQSHYSLESYYRHSRHRFYYQTAAGVRHDVLQSDFVEVNVDVNALPDLAVVANGRAQTFSMFLVRPGICEGVRSIVRSLRHNVLARKEGGEKKHASFLRTIPSWLLYFRFEGSDFGLQLAGVDEQVSKDSRGFALQLQSWNTEYKANREDDHEQYHHDTAAWRRSMTRIASGKDQLIKAPEPPTSPKKRPRSLGDGRRLAVHFQQLEGFIVDSIDDAEPDQFVHVPRFEVAFSTSTDTHGPIFHINSFAKSIILEYSLYNHFALGVAVMVIKRTFIDIEEKEDKDRPPVLNRKASLNLTQTNPVLEEIASREVTAIDFKTPLIQVKARLPHDPPMMLQIFSTDCGRHRWSTPFVRSKLIRLYVRAPATKSVWSRIVSVKVLRLDFRSLRRKVGKDFVNEKSIDVNSEVIRMAVPHSLIVHSIFDNITNIIKTTKQLQHHFTTRSNEYILTKEPEGPKHVPKVTIRTQLFIFDVEDAYFEWKLGAIYRAGLLEQKQRLAREEAFKLKEKRMARSNRRGSSRFRAQSANPEERARSHNRIAATPQQRSSSAHDADGDRPKSRNKHDRHRMRYKTEGQCTITDTSKLSIDAARDKLNILNAQSWKNRIDRTMRTQSTAMREMRTFLWGLDDIPDGIEQDEDILAISHRPSLMVIAITDLGITVDKPSFPLDKYPDFLHDVGKGMPKDMKYGLLVPMSLHITMGEARVQLRDYPLPMLHIPSLGPNQSVRLPAVSLKTDFVIAEEFRDIESQRHVEVVVIPEDKMSDKSNGPFCIDVRRTISSVKTYSDMKMEINSSGPTKMTWSTSYQPAIQDAMQVIEGFTKPPVDPSDKVGFWDKIRLAFHSRINISWKGDGDVHMVLKGSCDPYVVTGHGAGLVMVWRNDVSWDIARDKDPRRFMVVNCGDYILAVPDFNGYARKAHEHETNDGGSSASSSTMKRDAVFKKVIMKLSGKVTWLAGLMFERDVSGGGRSFEFKSHYDVVLKHPDFAKAPPGESYDAYRGFRSDYIHMSIAVAAPSDRDWSVTNLQPSHGYNSVHLTPRFFSHFFAWWSMFSGVMSLPIRQGPLWGIAQKKSKKFGRHITTIKYNILLSPVFISHVYKHKDAEDYQSNVVSATGLKIRLGSFMLDLHQRREHFDLKGKEGASTKKTSAMRINQAQLDFISADLRALSASIEGTSAQDLEKADDETLAMFHSAPTAADLSSFEIPDNDLTWIDMDDFVELDWILPADADPQTKILPLGYSPRFTYFRQTDHNGLVAGDPSRTSPFGDEPTHFCVMSAKNDPRRIQADLIDKRLQLLREKQSQNTRAIGEQELKLVRTGTHDKTEQNEMQSKLDHLKAHDDYLQAKHDLLQKMLNSLIQRLEQDDPAAVPGLETSEEFYEAHESVKNMDTETAHLDTTPLADYSSDFNNRFIVHNAQIKWNNSLRNIILRYIHQNSQRRGFVYYMSRRAVKFILDVLEERTNNDDVDTPQRAKSVSTDFDMVSPEADDEETIQERINQLLKDGRQFVDADDSLSEEEANLESKNKGPSDEIAVEFTPLNTYHFRLIAPQVQLQSEKNPKSAVLVTAKGMQLKVVQIMEKDKIDDDVSGLVQRRFHAAADSIQMFVTNSKTFSPEALHFYSANRYGTKSGSYWPPWVPMEIMFEFQSIPYGFNRVVHRTSASVRYDKYNALRLKYSDDVSRGESKEEDPESRMDHLWLEFPQFKAICDSNQYFAMYIIVMDLLLYNEPLEKTRSERLEKIMLASDFSDLTGAPEMVQMLQERIRQLEEIKLHFQVNEKYLDRQGWKDRIVIDQDLASCEDELFFMMKAITTSQQRVEDRREQENAVGLTHLHVASKEIAWHLIREQEESLVEFQLTDASFDRTDNNDGSNYNLMEIGRINGYNLLKDAIYPTIISPFEDEARGGRPLRQRKMLRIQWLMLEAIAGIPVVDYFEIDLVPLKLQVEREVASKLFEYVFPGHGKSDSDGGSFSPFMVKNMVPEDDENANDPEETGATARPAVENSELNHSQPDLNGPGSLEHRLKPTLHLTQHLPKRKQDGKGLGISGAAHAFTLFQHNDKAKNSSRSLASRQALSHANLTPITRSPSDRSLATNRSNVDHNDKNGSKFFPLHRTHSEETKKKDKEKEKDKDKEKDSDDLTQMMSRASNYMTLSFVKIPSMVLCLSYKGQGKRNIEDVYDLVFRMPTLEYRNKTWSNLDLALQLKKDVIKALINHAGAIVSNKFSHHKPSRQQQSRLRELATKNAFMSPRPDHNGISGPVIPTTDSSETSSLWENGTSELDLPRPASSALSRNMSISSTPPASIYDARGSVEVTNGHSTNGHHLKTPPSVGRSSQRSPPSADDNDDHRSRAASITRQLSSFGERLRPRLHSNAADSTYHNGSIHGTEEAEETKRKSRLLLGGQKLLGRLRDS